MNKNQVFVFLFLPLLVLSGCILDDSNSEDSDGVVLEVEIESNDSGVTVSDGTSDQLIDAVLQSPSQFNWSEIEVNIRYEMDNGAFEDITCSQSDDAAGCSISEGNGNSAWEQNEIINITENGLDICDSSNCNLLITIVLQPENEPGIILHQNEVVVN